MYLFVFVVKCLQKLQMKCLPFTKTTNEALASHPAVQYPIRAETVYR